MADVQIYMWDVELGNAMLIKAPRGNVVVDLGKHSNGFSPTTQMQRHGVEEIFYLIISHPDTDHIQDIITFYDNYYPSVLGHSPDTLSYVKHKRRYIYSNDKNYQQISGIYIDLLENHYTQRIEPPIEVGDMVVYEEWLTADEVGLTPAGRLRRDQNPNLNNLSLLNVIDYNGFKLTTMGDLESSAIEQLLRKPRVQRKLSGTDVLVAPHHGRSSSYTSALFDVISPALVAISDAAGTEHSASSQYSSQARGATVERRNGPATTRSVITTRNDGVLYFGIYSDGRYKVRID